MAYPRYQRARDFKRARRTAGNVTISTSLANVDTALDISLAAQVGDYIEYGVLAHITLINGSDAAFDVATIVSGSVVNYFGGSTLAVGNGPWYFGPPSGAGTSIPLMMSGSMLYPLVAADISAGTVTLRLRCIGGGSGAVSLKASSTEPLTVWAKNLGPADPN